MVSMPYGQVGTVLYINAGLRHRDALFKLLL
jgi:hypothetical protein